MYGNDRGFDGPRRNNFAPVKVGDELEVKIEAVGEKGDGIAKKNGFVIFVPNTKQDENVRIRITRVLRKVGFAEVVGAATGQADSSATSDESSDEPSGETPSSSDSAEDEDTEDFGEESEEQADDDQNFQ